MRATEYIDNLKDENGNVPVLLNEGPTKNNNVILVRISTELAKWLYLTPDTGVYYTCATRYVYNEKGIGEGYYRWLLTPGVDGVIREPKMLFGAIELYVEDFQNLHVYQW